MLNWPTTYWDPSLGVPAFSGFWLHRTYTRGFNVLWYLPRTIPILTVVPAICSTNAHQCSTIWATDSCRKAVKREGTRRQMTVVSGTSDIEPPPPIRLLNQDSDQLTSLPRSFGSALLLCSSTASTLARVTMAIDQNLENEVYRNRARKELLLVNRINTQATRDIVKHHILRALNATPADVTFRWPRNACVTEGRPPQPIHRSVIELTFYGS